MKKTLILFLTLLYLVTSFGFTSYSHLCMGLKQNTILLFNPGSNSNECPQCSDNHSEHKSQCCQKIKTDIKLGDRIFVKSIELQHKPILSSHFYRFTDIPVFQIFTKKDKLLKPVYLNGFTRNNSIYIINCVYRI